ncbi:MAG: transposase [Geminicoccaceae bacterium]
MGQGLLSDRGWSGLLAGLPEGLDLAASARVAGAFVRARGVGSAQALLRLALVYANTSLSLRATSAWAASAGVALLSDVALLYRLQRLEGWLGAILAALLGEVVRAPGELARPVQIVDATSLGWPGPRKGVAWRIHARLELAPTRFSGFVLTDGTGAERLDRFTPTPGAIVLADRCYARHGGMAAVWAAGADLVVRYGLSSSAVQDPEGARVTLNGVLGRPDRLDLPVRLPGPAGRWHPGRLILVRRPPGSAAKSRARIEQKARKRGGTATSKQRRAADWLVLLTTLDAATWPAGRVAALYRLRWQIELAFKRLKSQLRLADLQAKDPRLARACILAKLILALLADRLVEEHRRPFRLGPARARRPPCGA